MDHGPFMAANDPQMKIRIPEYLKDRLHDQAKRLGISMNQVIIDLLEDALIDFPLGETGPRQRLRTPEVSRQDLMQEFKSISDTINARNEDLAHLIAKLSSVKKDYSDPEMKLYRSFLVKRISELDEELTRLGKLYDDFSRKLRSGHSY